MHSSDFSAIHLLFNHIYFMKIDFVNKLVFIYFLKSGLYINRNW